MRMSFTWHGDIHRDNQWITSRTPRSPSSRVRSLGSLHPLAEPFRLEGSSGDAVLLIHGFGGNAAHFRMLGPFLHERGFTVHAPLLPGHGTSLDDMERSGRRDWESAVRTAFRTLAGECERVHVVGFSMGGLLAQQLAAEAHPVTVTTVNAPLNLYDRRQPLVHFLKYIRRFRAWDDPRPVPEDEAAEYWIHYEGFSLRAAAEMMHLRRAVRGLLYRVTSPALIIQSRNDESVRPESASLIAAQISSFRKEIFWLDGPGHNALHHPDRGLIHQKVLEHISRA